MAEAKPPTPWWEDRGRAPESAPEQAEKPAPPAEAPPQLNWFERREPFLKALSARIEPLEEVAVSIAGELAETRRELQAFVEETRRSLTQLAGSVSELHRDLASRTEALARQADRAAERSTEALEHTSAATVDTLTEAVRSSARETAEAATTAAAGSGREVLGGIEAAEASLQGRMAEVEESMGERRAEVDEALRAQVAAVGEALRAGFASVEAELRSSLAEAARSTDERLAGVRDELRLRLDEVDRAAAGRVDVGAAGIREAVDAVVVRLQDAAGADDVASLRSALDEAAGSIRVSVAEARRSVEQAVAQVSGALGRVATEERERLEARLAGPLAAVETGLVRVDRLAGVIDSLGHRRGFRELVESEQTLRREQARLVDRLAETAGGMTERFDALSGRLEALENDLRAVRAEATKLSSLPGDASERVTAAMEGVRSSIEAGLDRRFAAAVDGAVRDVRAALESGVPVAEVLSRLEALAAAHDVLARSQRHVEGLTDALTAEVVELRTTISGWGKPDTMPEVARRAGLLEGRVADLEEKVTGLVEAVADRVTAQVVEALDRRRRGLLRR